jgi:hypothetical protein
MKNPVHKPIPGPQTKQKTGLVIFTACKVLLLSLFTGCLLQGPWEYTSEEEHIHRGLWVNAFVIAGEPVDDVCIEKLMMLDDEYTDAFTYYASAEVAIEGMFDGTHQILVLSPDTGRGNCFIDDLGRLPEFFFLSDTARAPAMALTGQALDTSADTSSQTDPLALFTNLMESLPEEGQQELDSRYSDTLAILAQAGGDELADFLAQEMPNIIAIINDYMVEYENGDSLFFLTGDLFYTLTHLFSSTGSEDVGGVLITQRFGNTTAQLGSGLQIPPGFGEPDTADFFYSGESRILFALPNVQTTDGFSLLDSIPILNPFFFEGSNMFYIYGFEEAYIDYYETEIEGANNTRIRPKYNVQGAAGIFAGGILDSFEVFIKADAQTDVYPREVSKIAHCLEENENMAYWSSDPQCREYYPEYCEAIEWRYSGCIADLFYTVVELDLDMEALLDSFRVQDSLRMLDSIIAVDSLDSLHIRDSLWQIPDLDSIQRDSILDSILGLDTLNPWQKLDSIGVPDSMGIDAGIFEAAKPPGEMLYCIQNNYPDRVELCAEVQNECSADQGTNQCKEILWLYCLDNKWVPEPCQLGLVSYCKDRPRLSEVLCSHADAYCADHPGEDLCN